MTNGMMLSLLHLKAQLVVLAGMLEQEELNHLVEEEEELLP